MNSTNSRNDWRGFLKLLIVMIVLFCFVTLRPKSSSSSAPTVAQATIPETTVYDKDGVIVSISDLKGDGKLHFTVNNGSDNDIMFMFSNVAANRCMIYDETSYSKYVTPGNRVSGTYSLAGYSTYGTGEPLMIIDIDACITMYHDSGTDSEDFRATVRTSLYDEEKAVGVPTVNGYVSYEDENVRIIVTRTSDSLSDFDYYLENKTSKRVTAEFSHMSVNNEMCETPPLYWLQAFPHGYGYSKAIDSRGIISVYSAFENEVAAKGFDNVEKIGCTMTVILEDDTTGRRTFRYEVPKLSLYNKD